MSDESVRTELLAPGQAQALAGLLDVPTPDPTEGLPLTWHWIYLLEHPASADLGPDGHAVVGIPAPPEAGRRRMWAGGSIRSLAPLRPGREATRTTRVHSLQDKHGRTGRLTFLGVEHTIEQDGRVAVQERHDIVYRDAATTTAPTAEEPAAQQPENVPPGPDERELRITPPLLFRYSALTYNAHRIHYDRDYARDVEGYPGLVTHGPLQALLMAEAARAAGLVRPVGADDAPPVRFDYRLVSPLFDHQGLVAGARTETDDPARGHGSVVTWARDRSGRRTATGVIGPDPGDGV
ncbi:FAS1-like dehydratase domain-containing protein [Piscicoccus intestinalis]|uniref:FAS1-like dehydratase domain-containing protein n=1 Tax=Piscicoccus intestinalis TaxID=746033 RepID=UPI001C3F1F22|nr:MaoC family dehydratase N-terminal domain-containing protein [Piscicoccus intestinalis]